LPHGRLEIGGVADLTIFDPEREQVIEAGALHSRSSNSPFLGWTLRGTAMVTIVAGKVAFERL
jgi:dihydroorotase